MERERSEQIRRSTGLALLLAIGLLGAVAAFALAPLGRALAAGGGSATYTATVTIPVPPASTFAGSGGGDGWALAMTPAAVYNVFHHAGTLRVACHLQTDASACWDPKTITDANGNGFATSGQPGLWLDQASGHLYVYATRTSDHTGGVVCIDTTQPAAAPDPFCGFTPLSAAGDASSGISGISDPAVVGSRWYAFNYFSGSPVTGDRNKLLCFDLTTFAACPGQPYAVSVGSGTVSDSDFPPPEVAAIGSQVIVPITVDGNDALACFDGVAVATCAGSWPVKLGFSYDSSFGAPFPLLSASGAVTGLCLPAPSDPCFSLAGAPVSTPPGMTAAIMPTSGWNGPAFVLGPRVYVPDGNADRVDCYDFSAGQACANFPKAFANLGLLYTVNPDPQRPTCIWVNSDDGSGQIQNFDAFSGGSCGQGPLRVLASSFVVPTQLCRPTAFDSLTVVSPARSSYASGTIAFEDADGNPIPGVAPLPLDNTGSVDLTGLNLSSGNGLPQFLITLTGEQGSPGSVQVQVKWTATDDPSCVKPGTTVTGAAPGPVITSLAPASGTTAGGDGVVIFGSNLAGASVRFGAVPATVISVNTAGTRIVALTPPGTGTVDVTATTPSGTSATGAADRYTYVRPAPGTTGGSTTGGGTTGGGTTGGATTAGTTGGTTGGATTGGATTGGATTGATTTGSTGSGTTGGAGAGPGPAVQGAGAKVISSSSVELSAVVNPRGLPTTMHFEYAAAAPGGASAAAIAYDARTPEQTVGSDTADHTVTARVAGLLPNSVYHVRAVATNPQGVAPGADAAFKTATDPAPPPPVLGKSVNATPVSGVVYVLLPGAGHVAAAHASAAKGVGFVPLTEARQLPVGTIFDASHGVARLTTATATTSAVQAGSFGGGLFKFLQNRRERGLSELRLVAPSTAARRCAALGKAHTAAARALPKAVVNLLRANVKGRFRTRGRYSSATVRGTMWTTTDRCDGTLTAVQRGVVVVTNLRTKRRITLTAGRSYLAPAR